MGEFLSWGKIIAVLKTFKIKGNILKLFIKFFQPLTFRSVVNASVSTEDFEDGICAMWELSLNLVILCVWNYGYKTAMQGGNLSILSALVLQQPRYLLTYSSLYSYKKTLVYCQWLYEWFKYMGFAMGRNRPTVLDWYFL